MKNNLPKQARQVRKKLKEIEKTLRRGGTICEACGKAGISRTTYYRWLKKVEKRKPRPSSLRKLKATRRKEKILFERKVLRRVVAQPELTCRQLAKEYGKSPSFIWKILDKHDLGTRKKRKKWVRRTKVYPLKKKKYERSFGARVSLLERAETVGVSYVCREFDISRTLFYKWKNRQLAGEPLDDRQWRVERWGRQTPEEYERMVLGLVVKWPKLSVHRLVPSLPKVAGVPVVGHHGVQNILRRNGLNTYEKRLAYSRAQAPVLVTPITAWINRLKLVWEQFIPTLAPAPPPEFSRRIRAFAKSLLASSFASTFFLLAFLFFLQMVSGQPTSTKIGLFFASISLTIGSFFFAYSMKYYFTLALVLSFSRQPPQPGAGQAGEGIGVGLTGEFGKKRNGGIRGLVDRIFGRERRNGGEEEVRAPGLTPSLERIKLDRYPFVSIHLPFYNEKKVANRILAACTSMDYENYEVIVCDDSTDETVKIVKEWEKHPKVKVIHRPTREGFKGGALSYAVKYMDPRTEFVIVLDADFVPYPDTIEQFLKYFKTSGGWSEEKFCKAESIETMPYDTFSQVKIDPALQGKLALQEKELLKRSPIACVAGYQWHVLNKSENWITRGVRTEYAGSYVIERPGQEILSALKIIHGSVYMIRADVLKHFGWGTSITEDFELTLRIYEKGFKVAYTPYIQAPSECVSTIKRLVRQRMRWAEGHSFNVRKMFLRLLFGHWEEGKVPEVSNVSKREKAFDTSKRWVPSKLTLTEKLEFLYISPYYLQAFFFLVGTFSWLISETVFRARLPFWTSLWGWSLVLTNFFALPLMNAVGLFLEESEEKDYLGIFSFIALCYLVVPFQAYAAVKGFLETKEGPWFRTPKTGKITDILTRGRFYRWLTGILPRFRPVAGGVASLRLGEPKPLFNPYLALATANNRFSNFQIRPKRLRWVSKMVLIILLCFTVSLYTLAHNVSVVYATNPSGTFAIDSAASANINTSWQLKDNTWSAVSSTTQITAAKNTGSFQFQPGLNNSTAGTPGTPNGKGWIFDTAFDVGGNIADGDWTFKLCTGDSDTDAKGGGYLRVLAWKVALTGTPPNQTIDSSTNFFDTGTNCDTVAELWTGSGTTTPANRTCAFDPPNPTDATKTLATGEDYVRGITDDTNYVYAGLYLSPGEVVRINKSDFSTTVTKTLATGENSVYVLTEDTDYVYAGLVDTSPGKVVRINKSDFSTTVTKTLATGENFVTALTEDTNYVYAGLNTSPGKVVRINKSDFSTTVTKTLASGENYVWSLTDDTDYVYAGLNIAPGKVVRINKSDFSTTVTKTLATGENTVRGLTDDTNYVYAGLDTSPGKVVRINKSDFSTTVTKTLATGETSVYVLTDDTDYVYAGLNLSPGKVVRRSKTGGENNFDATQKYLYVEFWDVIDDANNDTTDNELFYAGDGSCSTDPQITTQTVTIPEYLLVLVFVVPFLPYFVKWLRKRKEKWRGPPYPRARDGPLAWLTSGFSPP